MYFSDIKIDINKGSQSQGDQGEGDLIGDLNLYLLYLLYLDIIKERAGASNIKGRNRGY